MPSPAGQSEWGRLGPGGLVTAHPSEHVLGDMEAKSPGSGFCVSGTGTQRERNIWIMKARATPGLCPSCQEGDVFPGTWGDSGVSGSASPVFTWIPQPLKTQQGPCKVLSTAAGTADNHHEKPKCQGRMEWPMRGDGSQWLLHGPIWNYPKAPQGTPRKEVTFQQRLKALHYWGGGTNQRKFHLLFRNCLPCCPFHARLSVPRDTQVKKPSLQSGSLELCNRGSEETEPSHVTESFSVAGH